MTLALSCGKCLKDRAHPTHDKDLPEYFDHEFVRIEVITSERESLWKNKGWWTFLGIVAVGLLLAVLLA